MHRNKSYTKYSQYLKSKFGERVQRISVDAGFSCPNQSDGKLGCIYCNNESFNFVKNRNIHSDLKTQIEAAIKYSKIRFKSEKFILYFQSNTNTFSDIKTLKKTYDIIKEFDEFVGLSIATRPDCIDDEILELIASYQRDYDVWLEYGLQSIHDETLTLINRGHNYETFLKAYETTKKKSLKVCAHIILGLPNETEEKILETANEMTRLQIDGLKLHPMHIVKNTSLEKIYGNFEFHFFEESKYIEILANFLGKLDEEIIIHGVIGACPRELLLKPTWLNNKDLMLQKIEEYMYNHKIWQGSKKDVL